VILGLSACDRAPDDTARVVDADILEPTAPAPAGDSASMRYTCEEGYGVAIMGDSALVTTRDGRAIDLQRVADRSPPLFAGEALEFSVESDGAVLGQDEGGRFPCREAD
jgi:hypothetical protein